MLVAPGAWERKDKVKRPMPVLRSHLKLVRASTLAVIAPEKWGGWWDGASIHRRTSNARAAANAPSTWRNPGSPGAYPESDQSHTGGTIGHHRYRPGDRRCHPRDPQPPGDAKVARVCGATRRWRQ